MSCCSELQREGTKPTLAEQAYCDEISQAVPLHDIGKISIPDKILNKEGTYTAEEFAVMRSHTERGGKLIEKTLSRLENYRYYQVAKNMALLPS
jgi:putative two-component system response regulator